MSEKKQTAPAAALDPEELVPYFVPALRDDEGPVYVCVNGDNVRFERDQQVMIKRKFAEVLDSAKRQQAVARKAMRKAAHVEVGQI